MLVSRVTLRPTPLHLAVSVCSGAGAAVQSQVHAEEASLSLLHAAVAATQTADQQPETSSEGTISENDEEQLLLAGV